MVAIVSWNRIAACETWIGFSALAPHRLLGGPWYDRLRISDVVGRSVEHSRGLTVAQVERAHRPTWIIF